MKIAIFDPSGSHGHYAYTQSIVFEKEHIEWFIHKNVTKRLNDLGVLDNGNNTFNSYSNKYFKYFYYLKSIISLNRRKWDIVFFNTLQSDWLPNFIFFLFIKKSVNIVLTIHNVNSFFATADKKSFTSFIKALTRSLALKKCKLNVYGTNLKQRLLEFRPNSEVFLFPYEAYSPKTIIHKKGNENILKIVIPGTVDLRRRNYELVLSVVKNISHIKHIQFILLGKPVGQGSTDLIAEFKKYRDSVIYYTSFVDEDEFEKQMLSADIVLGPLHKYFKTDETIEEYGVSKETGITFAIIKYALPGIFPAELTIMDEIKSGVTSYKDASELTEIITELSTNKHKLQQLKDNALANAQKFEVKKVKKDFLEQMNR